MGPYLNRKDLADALVSAVRQLRQAQEQTNGPGQSVRSAPLSARQWRVDDRLSEADAEQLVAAFTAGMSKRKLAERYGISESSVKRLPPPTAPAATQVPGPAPGPGQCRTSTVRRVPSRTQAF